MKTGQCALIVAPDHKYRPDKMYRHEAQTDKTHNGMGCKDKSSDNHKGEHGSKRIDTNSTSKYVDVPRLEPARAPLRPNTPSVKHHGDGKQDYGDE